ncbi:hypothetical protein PC123_g23551 [Phytophthora cactorum]|nr:hypothetical protein PC123_g23551 [Phytophthora cactorum]
MTITRSRSVESESPNPQQRQVPRTDQTEAATPQEAQSDTPQAVMPNTAPEAMSMQQLMLWITQQHQSPFEHLLLAQGDRRKKDPPMYEGNFSEDLEFWIFATEEYYVNKRGIMEAATSDFVTMILSSLGKSVLNWYRAF